METKENTANVSSNDKTTAAITHLSAFGQYFFPLANFILPIVIWSSFRKDSAFLDAQGKNVINFQLSVFLYTLVLAFIALPVAFYTMFENVPINEIFDRHHWFIRDLIAGQSVGVISLIAIAAFLFAFLKITEFFLIILGAVRAANGEIYKYPFCIRFIK